MVLRSKRRKLLRGQIHCLAVDQVRALRMRISFGFFDYVRFRIRLLERL